MVPLLRLVLLLFILSHITHAKEATGKGHKPEVGREDCKWWYKFADGSGSVYNVWMKVWDQKCKLDDDGKLIRDVRIPETNRTLDPCCNGYIGLLCRPTYWDKNEGVCYKPDPYQKGREWTPSRYLSMMKKKKLADGQQLDFMWDRVQLLPNT